MRFIHGLLLVSFTILACPAPRASATPTVIASDYHGWMRRVDPQTGAILEILDGGLGAGEIELGPDGLIYASYFESTKIRKIDPVTGAAAGDIALPGTPRDVTLGPDGTLYIALTGDRQAARGIYRLDPVTQDLSPPFNTFALDGAPTGIAFGPGGDLFVCLDERAENRHSVVRLDGQTGALKAVVTTTQLSVPQSLAFGPDGNLYVGNQGTGTITRYTPAGAYLGTLTSTAGNPQGLYFLPDGDLVWGRGGSDFARYRFSTGTQETFGSGYSFAHSILIVPEPELVMLIIPVVIVIARRRSLRSKSGAHP